MSCLCIHTIACFWFTVGTSGQEGWVEWTFGGTAMYCSCTQNYGLFYDAYFRACVDPMDEEAALQPICSAVDDNETEIGMGGTPYFSAMLSAVQEPALNRGMNMMSTGEKLYSTIAHWSIGALFGALAGAFSAMFTRNAMGAQEYRKAMMKLDEFCKTKQLPWPMRERLKAHYTHLYPDRLIIDDNEIIQDLPLYLRHEVVKQIHGEQVSSVPLFWGLEMEVMTEICLALNPIPFLHGDTVAREGQDGNEMYILATGLCRVTERVKTAAPDAERVLKWLEALMSTHTEEQFVMLPGTTRVAQQQRVLKRTSTSSNSAVEDMLVRELCAALSDGQLLIKVSL